MKPSNVLPLLVAVGSGVVTLALFFVRGVIVEGYNLSDGFSIILNWATTLMAITLLIGIGNLFAVHVRKVSDFSAGWPYSSVLLIAFIGTLVMWLLGNGLKLAMAQGLLPITPIATQLAALGLGITNASLLYVQTPVEASLSAMLAVIMILAGARLIRKQRNWTSVLFVGVSLLLIISLVPISFLPFLSSGYDFFMQSLAPGVVRGILFGVALGVIATGLRVIVGVDHPYGE